MLLNFDKLCVDLEKQELEAPNGIPPALVYAQLLGVYLYQNDLCNAKFLWKRIPQSITSSNPEIGAIWAVGQKLWKKDLAGTYVALSRYNWTEPVLNIMRALEAVLVKNYLKTLDWEVLPHPPYSPDIALSDYHLFWSMAHTLSEQRLTLYEDTKNWVDSWIASKYKEFCRLGIQTLPER
ncbi:COP9 signalosome complex subunit 8 [Eumeta japonica]|uniref:COP9 signalosome complex subunit 8 n=1 Tax=Eumeta variegata TaxID=151549 RepID=A0A4C1WC93_EUMVA|nr:COP9 signalosome complex subunit 8 [Eumeta japonica]